MSTSNGDALAGAMVFGFVAATIAAAVQAVRNPTGLCAAGFKAAAAAAEAAEGRKNSAALEVIDAERDLTHAREILVRARIAGAPRSERQTAEWAMLAAEARYESLRDRYAARYVA